MRSVTPRRFSFSALELICPERLELEKERGVAGLGCRRSRRPAKHNSLAASLFDLFDGRLGELVRVDCNGRGEFAGTENLDQRLLA